MPYIETPEDLAEHIANMCGVYGVAMDHPTDCRCRICLVHEMVDRIRASVLNELRVLSVKERNG